MMRFVNKSNWQTTAAGVLCAAGKIIAKSPNVPPWAWTIGECMETAGILLLGATAAVVPPRNGKGYGSGNGGISTGNTETITKNERPN